MSEQNVPRRLGVLVGGGPAPGINGVISAATIEAVEQGSPDGPQRLAGILDEVDRGILGSTHPVDHAYLRRDGRVGFLARERSGKVLGYAYGSGIGRLGPVAATDPALQPALLGTAIRDAPALGPVAIWVPGSASAAMRALLDAGLRIDGFPGVICWSRPDHPFERYLPISPGML